MYAKEEVVWAKIKGFPWWPAVVREFCKSVLNRSVQVAKVIEDKEEKGVISEVLVNFIGENSQYDKFE